MWPLWMIITVAVGGAVSLTVTAVLTVVYFERRRHRRLMAKHGLNRNPSQMHRHHLSITDVDIASLPRAARSLRDSYQRPRGDSIRFYATIPSQDDIKSFPESTTGVSVAEEKHIQTTDGARQWLAPSKSKRFTRKKKIAKVSTSLVMVRSPMSAITEATEPSRHGTPELVELPAHETLELTPERAAIPMTVKIVRDSHLSIDSILDPPNAITLQQGISHGAVLKSRSISAGSIALPPNIPLPPVPNTAPFDPRHRANLSRSKSDISLHNRDVSVLSQQASLKSSGGRFSGFMFELTGEDVSRKRSSKEYTSSVHDQTSFQFPKPEAVQTQDESFKTIDASTWNLPNSLRPSRPITPTPPTISPKSASRSVSMIDYDAIFSAGSSLNSSPMKPYGGTILRPVSAISMSSADMFRHSVVGAKVPESPRVVGHRRQNCVRIKNLTPVESKRRLSSQLSRLAEAEEDHDSILLPSPARVDQVPGGSIEKMSAPMIGHNESASASDTSLNVPVIRQPQAQSLRVKRPGWTSIKDKSKPVRPLPVPGDPTKQKQTSTHAAVTVEAPIASRRVGTEISPTMLEAIKTSENDNSDSPVSSIRTHSPNSPQRQRTQIQGPRNAPPPSLRVRQQTLAGSPIRRKSSENDRAGRQHQRQRNQIVDNVDMQKSIAMLKNITLPHTHGRHFTGSPPAMAMARTPSSRYADSPSIRVPKIRNRSNTVAGHVGERIQPPPSPKQPKKSFLDVPSDTPPNAGRFTYSPSSISIWEDESVGGDSPEQKSKQPLRQREVSTEDESNSGGYSPVKSRRDHFDQLSTYSRNMSSQQYQQLGQQSPIQRESLWRLQQNANVTGRALASTEKSPLRKGIVSPRPKIHFGLEGLKDVSPVTPTILSNEGRTRGHTTSVTAIPVTQTVYDQVGLGLKFGEKSMAYTVNEMDLIGSARMR